MNFDSINRSACIHACFNLTNAVSFIEKKCFDSALFAFFPYLEGMKSFQLPFKYIIREKVEIRL